MENTLYDSASASRPPSRKSVWAEQLDLAIAWITAAVVGAVAISILPEQRPLVRMIGPLVIMGGYLSFAMTRSRFSTAKVADSAYFMGFLWTLWALIDLLIVGQQRLTAQDLYIAFGYALTATAAGMFFRLAILQFFRTLDEQEEQAVDAVDDRARRLIEELERAQLALVELRSLGREKLENWQTDFEDRAKTQLDGVSTMAADFKNEGETLTQSVKGIRTSVSITGKAFVDIEKRLTAASARVAEQIDAAGTQLEGRFRDVAVRIAAIDVPTDALTKPLSTFISEIELAIVPVRILATETLQQLGARVSELADVITKLPHAQELQNAARDTVSRLNAASEACTELTSKVSAAAGAFAHLNTEVSKTGQIARTTGDEFVARVATMREHIDAAQSAIDSLDDSTKQTKDTLVEVVTFVKRELPRV